MEQFTNLSIRLAVRFGTQVPIIGTDQQAEVVGYDAHGRPWARIGEQVFLLDGAVYDTPEARALADQAERG